MCSNNIHPDGLIALGNSLYKNSTLLFLFLWGNHFENNSCQLFHQIFERKQMEYERQRKWKGDNEEEDYELKVDIEVYEVDGIYYAAEKSI